MPTPGERKTVQARILAYAQEIGWRYVSRAEAERRRGFTPHPSPLPQGLTCPTSFCWTRELWLCKLYPAMRIGGQQID